MIVRIRELSSPNWQPIETAPKDGTEIQRLDETKFLPPPQGDRP